MPKSYVGDRLLEARGNRDIKPFNTSDELFIQGSDGAHDALQKAALMLPEYKTWEIFFAKLCVVEERDPEQNDLLEIGLRLSSTKPSIIPGWVDTKLKSSQIADGWVGAQKVFGSLWHPTNAPAEQKKTSFESSVKTSSKTSALTSAVRTSKYSPLKTPITSKTSTEEKSNLETTNDPAAKKPSPFFKARALKPPKKQKKMGKSTKFKTHLKFSLPISLTNREDYVSVEKEIFRVLHTIWDSILAIDPRNVFLLSWHERDENKFPPIRQASTKPASRFAIEQKYVEEWKIGWYSDSTTIRFRIGHEKEIDHYLGNTRLCTLVEESMGSLVKDKLQSSETVAAVWLAGPIPEESTRELIEETILAANIFTSNHITDFELQILPIRIKKGALQKGAKRVKAIHAVCSMGDSDKVRDIMKRMYPSKPRSEYPEGVQWRAIENTADPEFPVSPRARLIAERMKYKQANFLKSIRVSTYSHIANLHLQLDTFPFQVLSRILYNWRSCNDLDQRLFILVEQEYEDAPVKFSYSASLENEVDSILPVLPLILIGRLGERARQWFLDTHIRGTRGYCFDKPNDRIIPTQNNDMEDLDRNWDQPTEGLEVSAGYDEYSDDIHGGFAIEFGGFEPSETPANTLLNDGTESLETMGIRNKEHDDDHSVWSDAPEENQFVSTESGDTVASTLTSDNSAQLALLAKLLENSKLDQDTRKVLEDSAESIRKISKITQVAGPAMDES